MFTLLDRLALLGHSLDDAVDRLLLVRLWLFDVGAIAKVSHDQGLCDGVKLNSSVGTDDGAFGLNQTVSWM